jgi:hypothetical protein
VQGMRAGLNVVQEAAVCAKLRLQVSEWKGLEGSMTNNRQSSSTACSSSSCYQLSHSILDRLLW